MVVWRCFSFSKGVFSGSILVFGGVALFSGAFWVWGVFGGWCFFLLGPKKCPLVFAMKFRIILCGFRKIRIWRDLSKTIEEPAKTVSSQSLGRFNRLTILLTHWLTSKNISNFERIDSGLHFQHVGVFFPWDAQAPSSGGRLVLFERLP